MAGCGGDGLHLWELDWEYEFPEPAEWDDGVQPYVDAFLTCLCKLEPDGWSREGKPHWAGPDFRRLMEDLPYRGYGWLRADGLRRKLQELTSKWEKPPRAAGTERAVRLLRGYLDRL